MKIWFDTEFIEDGRTIDLISIGIIREDGATYYAHSSQYDVGKASEWVRKNVLPHVGETPPILRRRIADDIRAFAGEKPQFWAYYADYDWVALCQLYGTMMDLPKGWPMYCRDVKQLCDDRGNPELPKQGKGEHHALADAVWTKSAWEFLSSPQIPGIYPGPINGDRLQFEAEHANTKPEDRPDWPLPSFDARDWAKAFCRPFIVQRRAGCDTKPVDDDEGLMQTWFANALMRGYDEHAARAAANSPDRSR